MNYSVSQRVFSYRDFFWLDCRIPGPLIFIFDVKNVHKKVLSFVSSRRFGNNPFISQAVRPESNVHSTRTYFHLDH